MPNLSDFIALGMFIIACYIAWKKTPHENRASDGGAANMFEQSATSAAKRNIELQQQNAELEKQIETIEKERDTERVLRLKFEDYSNRLAYQIKSFPENYTPVPFEQYPRGADTVKRDAA